jgi:hypothetical protein
MQRGQASTVVLPPLRPLFARQQADDEGEHARDEDARHHFAELAAASGALGAGGSLRTPTSVQMNGFLGVSFPSSSPVKKDSTLLLGGKGRANTMPLLRLNSPSADSSDGFDAPQDPSKAFSGASEDEKLRVSRERNRLHAQRTRIRKRELLESLKDRISSLQEEYELLKQTYEFHATATCLLTLGDVPRQSFACVRQLDEAGDDPMEESEECDPLAALAAHHSSNATDECMDDGDESSHEKGCMCHDEELSTDERANACTCIAKELQSKRAGSLTGSMACSKEEREQIRRERNRLHARRARLRKKLVLERSQHVCRR